jgi:thiol-disulfide isomerase/thioredoxin
LATEEFFVKRLILIAAMAALIFPMQSAQAGLKVGDPAPALSIKHWVKGEAFDLAKAKPGSVTVVEFWATWCGPCVMGIPHMSEMNDHFKTQGVTIIGVSDEKKETVEKFLAEGYDSKMRYTVAIDDGGKTNTAYMKASGQGGIPCAFVVKDGKIAWIGHPMNGLDTEIAKHCGDTKYAERQAKLKSLTEDIQKSAEAEKWDGVQVALGEYLKLEPKSIQHQLAMYHLLLVKLKKPEDAAKHGKAFVEATSEVDGLNTMAWVIVKHQDFEGVRDLSLATDAAKKAMTLSKEESVEVLDTYAMVLSETGKHDDAVKVQEKAIAKCGEEDPRAKRELTTRLEEYKKKQKGA